MKNFLWNRSQINRQPEEPNPAKRRLPPFIDLAPTNEADESGTYSIALNEALANDNIRNIALSGPYGSGKSSIIKTYVDKSDLAFLNISLASFTANDGKVGAKSSDSIHTDQQLIEKSILQQLLYGEAASKLPQSRFKRIHSPKFTLAKAMAAVLWIVTAFYIFKNINDLVDLSLFNSGEGKGILRWIPAIFNGAIVAFFLSGITVAIDYTIRTSSGLSLKRISLKNAEIEADADREESILNRHLDEIVYFFQQTDYDVVVFEDLDRFDNPDIFVKLREINTIVNSARKGKTPVKFLYALKDHIFKGRNRAKFFDFIIPVVPIINNTNSLDKIQERLRDTEIEGKIDVQFLRESSLFLDDLRLIHNSVNELSVYYSLLRSDKLNVTKLFALVLYKNVYPTDFEDLHFRKGALFEILQLKGSLIGELTADLNAQAGELRKLLDAADQEKETDRENLRRQYIGEISRHIPASNSSGVRIGNTTYSYDDLFKDQVFDLLCKETTLQYYQSNYRRPANIGLSFKDIEDKIDAENSYQNRLQAVENSTLERKERLQNDLLLIESAISTIRLKSIRELIKKSKFDINARLESYGIQNPALLSYLIGNGYLDETYHHYTSTFHEGRMSAHDRDFILAIRSFNPMEPNYKIDNEEETIASLRASDFHDVSTLNTSIIEFMLKQPSRFSSELNASVSAIIKNFEGAENFFEAAFADANYVIDLVEMLSSKWGDYPAAATGAKHSLLHVSYLLSALSAERVREVLHDSVGVDDFIQNHLEPLFDNRGVDLLDKLSDAGFLIEKLSRESYSEGLTREILSRRMYKFTPENVDYLVVKYLKSIEGYDSQVETTLNTANFTSVLHCENADLLDFVSRNFEEYVEKVILRESNTEESTDALLHILLSPDLDRQTKIEVLDHVSTRIPDVTLVPSSLRVYAMSNRTTPITWLNVLVLCKDNTIDKTEIAKLLNSEDALNALSQSVLDGSVADASNLNVLRNLILRSPEIALPALKSYLPVLGLRLEEVPADLEEDRIEALLESASITLNKETFEYLSDNEELLVSLLQNEVTTFIDRLELFPTSDDVKLSVAIATNEDDAAYRLMGFVDQDLILTNSQAVRRISKLLDLGFDPLTFNAEVGVAAIQKLPTNGVKAKVLTLVVPHWEWADISSVLRSMGGSYSDITKTGSRPSIPDTEVNRNLVSKLEDAGYISSSSKKWRGIQVNTFRRGIL